MSSRLVLCFQSCPFLRSCFSMAGSSRVFSGFSCEAAESPWRMLSEHKPAGSCTVHFIGSLQTATLVSVWPWQPPVLILNLQTTFRCKILAEELHRRSRARRGKGARPRGPLLHPRLLAHTVWCAGVTLLTRAFSVFGIRIKL